LAGRSLGLAVRNLSLAGAGLGRRGGSLCALLLLAVGLRLARLLARLGSVVSFKAGPIFSAGALCFAAGAGDGACAEATPTPAINAATATDISKLFLVLFMEILRLTLCF
jgi:hypothetical protein